MRLIKVIENKYIYKFKNNKKINYKLCTQHNAALHQKKKNIMRPKEEPITMEKNEA